MGKALEAIYHCIQRNKAGTISTVEATSHFLVTILSQTCQKKKVIHNNLTGTALVTKRSRLEIIRRKNQSYIFPSLP